MKRTPIGKGIEEPLLACAACLPKLKEHAAKRRERAPGMGEGEAAASRAMREGRL